MSSILTWFADKILDRRRRRTEVHLRVHRAVFVPTGQTDDPYVVTRQFLAQSREAYFLNVLNASPEQRVQVTHVYIETPTEQIGVLTKRLPVTIEPRHEWETWIPIEYVPAGVEVENSARARLSDGRIIESVRREDVPTSGAVPDG